jgi:hypothetical protein
VQTPGALLDPLGLRDPIIYVPSTPGVVVGDYVVGVGVVPELSRWAMMLLGFAGVGFAAYRRRSPKNGFWLAAA